VKKNFLIPDFAEHQNQLNTFVERQKEQKTDNTKTKKSNNNGGETPDKLSNAPSAGESKTKLIV